MKKPLIISGVIVAILVAFAGGFAAGKFTSGPGGLAGGAAFPGGPGGNAQGGPMAQLSESDRAKLQSMTPEEARKFMQEKLGDKAPTGMRGPGGGLIEGEVIESAADNVTIKLSSGGSQTVYLTKDTVTAYVEGAAKLATGSKVMVFAEPETDEVTNATVLVVK